MNEKPLSRRDKNYTNHADFIKMIGTYAIFKKNGHLCCFIDDAVDVHAKISNPTQRGYGMNQIEKLKRAIQEKRDEYNRDGSTHFRSSSKADALNGVLILINSLPSAPEDGLYNDFLNWLTEQERDGKFRDEGVPIGNSTRIFLSTVKDYLDSRSSPHPDQPRVCEWKEDDDYDLGGIYHTACVK